MKAITIRGIDSSVYSKLKQVAKNEKKSVNQLVLDMIKQNVRTQKRKKYTKKYNDLDHLFGSGYQKIWDRDTMASDYASFALYINGRNLP